MSVSKEIDLDIVVRVMYYKALGYLFIMSKERRHSDICIVKHAAYLRALKAGLLRNGHVAVGGTMGREKSKAAKNKKICRSKVGSGT